MYVSYIMIIIYQTKNITQNNGLKIYLYTWKKKEAHKVTYTTKSSRYNTTSYLNQIHKKSHFIINCWQ